MHENDYYAHNPVGFISNILSLMRVLISDICAGVGCDAFAVPPTEEFELLAFVGGAR